MGSHSGKQNIETKSKLPQLSVKGRKLSHHNETKSSKSIINDFTSIFKKDNKSATTSRKVSDTITDEDSNNSER